MRYRFARVAAAALLILSIAACGGSSGVDFIWLRVIHAMPDSPSLRVSFENYVFRRDVAYGTSTQEGGESLLKSAGSTALLTADYFQPGGSLGGTLLTLDVPLEKDATSTVIFAGSFDDPQTITIVSPRLERPLAAMHVQFAHAALEFGGVDIYVTAPDTELAATAPLVTVQPGGFSDTLEIPFGETRIRLTPAGSLDVLMDSGELDFPESDTATGPGMQWLFTVSPSVLAGPSPLFLIGSTGRQTFRFLDAGTPASLRAVHALPDTPPVDVLIASDTPITLLAELEYGARSPVLAVPLGTVPIGFRHSGEGGELVATREETLSAGDEVTAFLIGPAENAAVRTNISSSRSVVNEAKIRFANLAPDSKFFSIHLTSSADEAPAAANRVLRDLRFGASSNYVARTPGNYFLVVTERFFEEQSEAADAEETIAFGPTPLELVGGDVFTWMFFAPQNEGEPEALEVFDDRLP